MRDIFYVELGKRAEEIRQMELAATPEETQTRNLHLLETIDEIVHLSNVGRKEGLLALECTAYEMVESSKKYIKNMIELVVDGTDPKLVEEICLMKYMANGIKAYEGLEYMLQMVGILAIQQGENPRVIQEKLLAMIPDEAEDIFRKREAEEIKSWYEQKTEDIDMSKVEKLYTGELNTKIVEQGYPELEKLDYLLMHIEDRSLQRALREIDNADLELAMKGLSGEGRQRIFINMSKRLCIMIAEDMENMGRGRKSEIGEAAQKIYGIFMRLMDCYEIMANESDEIYALYQEYKYTSDDDSEGGEEKKEDILSLEEMLKLLNGNNS